jgi:pyridinium-3,5-bisthiocarboxylic acid mononucleotide nickel chelatase
MAKIAYLDCFSGVSGNMLLGALLDCGLDPDVFRGKLRGLAVGGYRLDIEETRKSGLRGLHVAVHVDSDQPHRHLAEIDKLIDASDFPVRVKETGRRVFRRLAEAEAKVHGEPVERVHFHEVGAVDALVDILGSALCLEMLGVEKIFCSPLPQGKGMVDTAHGLLPIPAPATAELLRGVPVYGRDVDAELVTPTGAALVATLAEGFGTLPAMRLARIGCGAGARDLPWANLLRVVVGETETGESAFDRVLEVQANIDDMNPEWYDYVEEKLLAAGVLDVFLTLIQMKRGRPALQLGLLVEESNLEEALGILFTETTTIGVRMHSVERRKLDRESIGVSTEYGKVMVKIARREGKIVNLAPEYRDCLRIAKEQGIPLKEVYASASMCARSAFKMG